VGGLADGFKIIMSSLDGGRVLIGARYVGIAQAAFEAALNTPNRESSLQAHQQISGDPFQNSGYGPGD
jgi:alkylation response protein AidB-like acyl-CoA dehydrogenase